MLRRLATAIALVLIVVPAASGAAPTPTDPPSTRDTAKAPLRYVAMGDSYSAASAVLPIAPTAPLPCLRSTRNYPAVIAAATGAQLTDVTCGAAQTSDFTTAQYPGLVPPQLRALRRTTQLVTLTIGGNDSSTFLGAILRCGAAGVLTLGQGSPCRDQYGDSFERTIRRTTFPDIVATLRSIKRAAPRAEVAILGYPWIVPRRGGCFDKLPIARGDIPYLRSLQATLNDAVRRAALRTGATYVNFNRVSHGHDACKPAGVRWIEPVLQGTNPVIVHPNALGERRMAAHTIRRLDLRTK